MQVLRISIEMAAFPIENSTKTAAILSTEIRSVMRTMFFNDSYLVHTVRTDAFCAALKLMNAGLEMMNSGLEMMNFALEMMNSGLEMMHSVLERMNFILK